ncbi:MAG: TonB-dependent siderophore receptor [Acidovorax sp.]
MPRSPSCRPAPLALVVALAVAAVAAHAQSSSAGVSGAPVSFHLAVQPLSQALSNWALQTGVQLIVQPALVAGKTAPAVSGTLTPNQALDRLLAGSGLAAAREGNAVVIKAAVAPAGSATLPVVTVTGAVDPEAVRLNPPTSIGSKTPLTQREIPQSVTVISQEQIEQQNMRTLSDALLYTPGVTVAQSDSERPDYYSRGFVINTWMLDGLPTTQYLTSAPLNLAMFDRVEVLKGPDGLMSGFGTAGGTVNLVRKRAPSTFIASAELLGGTHLDVGGTLDVGGPINEAKTLRGRVVANVENQDLIWDTSWRHDRLLYGTLEADLTPSTLLRVGASYGEADQRANWTGSMAYATPINGTYQLFGSPSTNLSAPGGHNRYSSATVFAELEQKLAAGWSAKLGFNHLENQSSVLNYTGMGLVDNATNLQSVSADKWHQKDNQDSVDAFVTGPLQLFGRTHALTFGASYTRENWRRQNNYCGPDESSSGDRWCDGTMTLFELQNAPMPSFNGPASQASLVTNQYGLYANGRFSLADPLTLILGARATWWDTSNYSEPDHTLTGSSRISGKVTPYTGLIYDINKNYSAYVSFASIFNPQDAQDYQGKVLPPLEGAQYEAGIKGEHLNGKLNTSLAVFQLTEQNRAISDPRYPNQGYSIATGRARSQGIELTATGHLTEDWTLFGGYTYTDAKYLDDSANANGVGFSSIAPRHLLKLWTNYRLPGELNKFTIGGGVKFSSRIWATDGAGNYLRQGSVATFDLRAAYQINDRLSASISVTNLFNRTYLSSMETPYGGFYGAPRQVLFKLRYAL